MEDNRIYITTGILVGTFGGMIMEKFGWGKYLQDYLLNKATKTENFCGCSCSCGGKEVKLTIKERIKGAFIYA